VLEGGVEVRAQRVDVRAAGELVLDRQRPAIEREDP
jgi:hypothetical protein